MAYNPIPEENLHYYGELPEESGSSKSYEISLSGIPSKAKEILVYIWATTKGDEDFHRYYYRIHTTDGTNKYNQYMNVAASRDVSLNSANLWLPVFPRYGTILVDLVDAEKKSAKGKRIAHRGKSALKEDGTITFSELFVLGYRE